MFRNPNHRTRLHHCHMPADGRQASYMTVCWATICVGVMLTALIQTVGNNDYAAHHSNTVQPDNYSMVEYDSMHRYRFAQLPVKCWDIWRLCLPPPIRRRCSAQSRARAMLSLWDMWKRSSPKSERYCMWRLWPKKMAPCQVTDY